MTHAFRALALLLLSAGIVSAQATKTMTYDTKVETLTVQAIESSSRTLTLKRPDGTFLTTVAPAGMARFDEVKVGDKVTARYYENLVVRVKPVGEKAIDTASASTISSSGAHPGGTAAVQRAITATVTALDRKASTITVVGPNDWKYSSRVEDKKALDKVKVGDRLDMVWTDALLISLETSKK